jgi:hypothetical protein
MQELAQRSPTLAGRIGLSTGQYTIEDIARDIAAVVLAHEEPLPEEDAEDS